MLLIRARWMVGIVWTAVIFQIICPGVTFGEVDLFGKEMAIQQVEVITPMSRDMIHKASEILAKGWTAMNPDEQEIFLLLFDPSGTGEIDDQYVAKVLQNYKKIEVAFEQRITIEYEPNSKMCIDQRQFYTDLFKLHVCPHFLIETNARLKARTLIHELAHKGLLATDRPYYSPSSQEYAELTPRGLWTTGLPLVGPIIREFHHSDTLYHPDAYAHFASAMSGQQGVIELYLDHGSGGQDVGQIVDNGSSNQASISGIMWLRRH